MEEDRYERIKKGRTGRKIVRVLAFAILGVIVAALFALVFGFVFKWLWNWLMPDIFGLRQISYWQAFGLLLLGKLLFGGFRHPAPRHRHGHRIKKGFFHSSVDPFGHRGERGQEPIERSGTNPGERATGASEESPQ
jgi:hypothetical protein